VADYYHRSKAVDDPRKSGFALKAGGKSLPFTQALVNESLQLEHSASVPYSAWQDVTADYRTRVLKQSLRKSLSAKDLLRERPELYSGPTACGPTVSASKRFVEFLLGMNRSFLSLDMESYGVARAARKTSLSVLSIRAISDFSDDRKNQLEASTKGLIRRIAVQHLATFLSLYLTQMTTLSRTREIPESDTGPHGTVFDRLTAMSSRFLEPRVTKSRATALTPKRPPITTRQTKKHALYAAYVPEIETHIRATSSGANVLIQGGPGAGKSYLLRTIYDHFISLNASGDTSLFPIYIDLKIYDEAVLSSQESSKAALKEFQKDLGALTGDLIASTDSTLVICIDSIDHHAAYRSGLEDYLLSIVEGLTGASRIIAVGDDNRDSARVMLWTTNPSMELTLGPCEAGSSEAEDLIALLVQTEAASRAITVEEVKSLVARFDIRQLDYLTVRTLIRQTRDAALDNKSSIGDLYQIVCEEYIKKHTSLPPARGLSMIAEMAHSEFIQLRRKNRIGENAHAIWKLLHYHRTVQDFLIAYHVIDVLREIGRGVTARKSHLNYVFPERIDRLCKGIMSHTERIERECLDGAVKLHDIFLKHPSDYAYAMTHVSYLLGRVRHTNSKHRAIALLQAWAEEYKEADVWGRRWIQQIQLERGLLYARTLSISLAYLGVEGFAESYITKLIYDAKQDNLNRGFHLEYYHDKLYLPDELQLTHEDCLEEFPNTFGALVRRIEDHFQNRTNPIFEIEWYTLLSLSQHRHAARLLPAVIRDKLKGLIEVSAQVRMCDTLRAYTGMLERSLDSSYPARKVLDELYKLKGIKRVGWTSRGMANTESVPDHVFGTMLLARLLLPETNSDGGKLPNGYDKEEVMRMLLIHELAEAYTGDRLPSEHSSVEEEGWFTKMETALTYRVFPGLENIHHDWHAFEYSDNLNARIARDLDKIENLVQLWMYALVEGREVPEVGEWVLDLIQDVKTDIGKGLLSTVRTLFGVA
jgi:5'-deoxynucleotidase YfbR-like HD superfamily hydrolase